MFLIAVLNYLDKLCFVTVTDLCNKKIKRTNDWTIRLCTFP